MVLKWKIDFPAPKGEDVRFAYIYLPEDYDHSDKRYSVLYMFDGHNVFFDSDATYGKSWGMKEYLDRTKLDIIVAAVECNHSPDHGRLSEYAPYSFKEAGFGSFEGKGELTMDWYIHFFKKNVDKYFRTLPDRKHTYIAGSSMGGLMSLYALIQHNDVFGAAAALSPAVYLNRKEMAKLIKTTDVDPDTVLYMDYGSEELAQHKGGRKAFIKFCGLLLERGLYLTSRVVPKGTHSEASWEKQLPFVFDTLLYK